MFLILEGEGELRFGDKRYPLRKHDVIACPPGGPSVAHQIVNTGEQVMRYLSLSSLAEVEACEYPNSQKILVVAGPRGARSIRKMFRAERRGRLLRSREGLSRIWSCHLHTAVRSWAANSIRGDPDADRGEFEGRHCRGGSRSGCR